MNQTQGPHILVDSYATAVRMFLDYPRTAQWDGRTSHIAVDGFPVVIGPHLPRGAAFLVNVISPTIAVPIRLPNNEQG